MSVRDLPHPSECPAVVGIPLAAVGLIASVTMIFVGGFHPWGWLLLVGSGTLWGVSWLVCMGWEWDHFPTR